MWKGALQKKRACCGFRRGSSQPAAAVAKITLLADDGLVPPKAEHEHKGDDRADDWRRQNQHLKRDVGHQVVDDDDEQQQGPEDGHRRVHEAVEVCVEPSQLAAGIERSDGNSTTGHRRLLVKCAVPGMATENIISRNNLIVNH
ncbi:MAG: hypothetical protein JWN64_156 [Parcubacteria group bacterium]|nr:hypothetical protein [Parcubacteria group bacterium]